jgi:rubrerythrin
MPNFASALTEPLNGRKLTKEELVRAVRFLVSAEYEAVQMYQQVVEATDDELSIKVINSIIDEEKVHAGEFLKLLHELDPEEAKHYKDGEKEVDDEKGSTNESVEKLMRLIDEKTVTAEDFDRFIAETFPTSINKRVQRQMRPGKVGPQVSKPGKKVDDKTDHEPSGHHNPTSTPRGRSALRKRIKHNKSHPNEFQFHEAAEFLKKHNGIPLSECESKLCEVDQASLYKLIKRLLQRPNPLNQSWLIGLGQLISNRTEG